MITEKPFAYFAEIEPISKSSNLFEGLNEKNYQYYYFQKNQAFYIFLFGKEGNNLVEYLLSFLKIRKELDTKKRKIRSIRGFLFYVLETIEYDETLVTVLKTNLSPFFWKRVQNVLKQNKKDNLLNFLFGTLEFFPTSSIKLKYLELENQVSKIKSELEVLKKQTSETILLQKKMKIIIDEKKDESSNPTNLNFLQHQQPFKIFNELPEKEMIQIICEGNKYRQKNLIKITEYYEGTQNPYSLLNLKGYSIKYETVRKHPLYKHYKSKLKV